MTTDEELDHLDHQLRRLKIEYEIFFNNPRKRPPTDIEWKVLLLIRKFSDGSRMSFAQRFRYNEMAQRYAIQSDLWRKKTRIREEGIRRPQEALLSVQGAEMDRGRLEAKRPVYGVGKRAAAAASPAAEGAEAFSVEFSGAEAERVRVESLYRVLTNAKKQFGEEVSGDLDSFAAFVKKKTSEIREEKRCDAVVYSVETEGGQVRLKAKAKS